MSASVSSSGLASSILITGLKFVLIRFPVCPASMEAAIAVPRRPAARSSGVSRRYTSMALVLLHRPQRPRTVSSLTARWNAHSASGHPEAVRSEPRDPWVSRGSPAAAATLDHRCLDPGLRDPGAPLSWPGSAPIAGVLGSTPTGARWGRRSPAPLSPLGPAGPSWSWPLPAPAANAGAVPIGPSRRPRSGPSVLRSVGGTRSQSSGAGSPTALDVESEWGPSPFAGPRPLFAMRSLRSTCT